MGLGGGTWGWEVGLGGEEGLGEKGDYFLLK